MEHWVEQFKERTSQDDGKTNRIILIFSSFHYSIVPPFHPSGAKIPDQHRAARAREARGGSAVP
jgi:hypothetical protein